MQLITLNSQLFLSAVSRLDTRRLNAAFLRPRSFQRKRGASSKKFALYSISLFEKSQRVRLRCCLQTVPNSKSNHSIINVTCQLVKRVSERIRFLTYNVLSYFEALGSQSLQREREPLVKILQFWDQSVWEVSTGKAMLLSSRCTKWQRVMAKVKIQL